MTWPVTINGNTYNEADFEAYGYKTALPALIADVAAVAAAAAASTANLSSTSTTSNSIGTGSKTFTVQAGKAYMPGMWIRAASTADATNRMEGVCTAYDSGTGSLTFLSEVIYGSGTGLTSWTITAGVPVSGIGKQTAWMPASAITPRTTGGAARGSYEMATNKEMVVTLDFDAASVEYGHFVFAMPKGYDLSTLTFRFVWSHPSTTTNFGVVWAIRAVATGDDDALDAAFGTAVTVTDTGGTTNDQYTTSETSALTVAGTPAQHDLIRFEVYRLATDGSDTLAVDARLEGVIVYYTINSLSDA